MNLRRFFAQLLAHTKSGQDKPLAEREKLVDQMAVVGLRRLLDLRVGPENAEAPKRSSGPGASKPARGPRP